MSGVISFLAGLLGKLLGLWKSQPSRLEVQTERAAVSETKLSAQSKAMKAEVAISKAEAEAPKDVPAVMEVLRRGEF